MKKNENESVNKYVPSKQSTSTVRTQQSTADNDLASSLTIYDLYLSEAKDSVKFDIVATTVMSKCVGRNLYTNVHEFFVWGL